MINHVDSTQESPVILSLCTGMRGLERGIERAIGHITVAAYVEIEAFVIYNLARQMEQGMVDAAPVWTDLKTFSAEQFHRKVHGIIGGYPCQPFSVAGKQAGTDDPRHLWPFIKNLIETISPQWCFFENVANHLNIGYEQVRTELQGLGYTVKEGIYSAEEVGAPHERKRLFILAVGNTFSSEQSTKRNHYGEMLGLSESQWAKLGAAVSGRSGEKLADASEQRFPSRGGQDTEQSELRTNGAQQSPGNSWSTAEGENHERRFNRWPAGAGPQQYEWEEPRTVEPGLGCTINGYNFRTDLLRLYGNGVVEQTAELAFIDLLKKHFND